MMFLNSRMDTVKCYTFSYKNPDRRQRMQERFDSEGVPLEFVDCVETSDPRVSCGPPGGQRPWAIMWNHLDMLKRFLETDALYGIFCEDDIKIRKGFSQILPEVLLAYKRLGLDILLLGYLIPHKPAVNTTTLPKLEEPITYLRFWNDLWGSQMYMLNRETAKRFLQKYTVDYAMATMSDPSLPPFSPDWTLTKYGNRAAIYPMLALEEGVVATDHYGQQEFHRNCYKAHADDNLYY